MRAFVPVLLLLMLTACLPTGSRPGGPGAPAPVSIEFYLIHEEFVEGLTPRVVERTGETVLLASQPDLTEDHIGWAASEVDRVAGQPYILLHFTPLGTDKLATLTRGNIGKRLAVFVDGRIISTPMIQGVIDDGRVTIRGFKTIDEARRVARFLARRR
jgi:preprotein translocase subunit SecD